MNCNACSEGREAWAAMAVASRAPRWPVLQLKEFSHVKNREQTQICVLGALAGDAGVCHLPQGYRLWL